MEKAIRINLENAQLRQQLAQAQRRIKSLEEQLASKTIYREAVEAIHKNVVEHVPLPFLEFDLSATRKHFSQLASQGLTEVESYLLKGHQNLDSVIKLARTTFLNQAAQKLFKVSSGEEFIKKFKQFFTRKCTEDFCHILDELNQGKQYNTLQTTINAVSGEILHVAAFWAVAPGSESCWKSVWLALLDITPQKLAEQALAQSESRYRSLFEDNSSAMCLIDPKNGRIISANPSACRFYGYDRRNMTEMTWEALDPPGHEQQFPWLVEASQGPLRLEMRQQMAGGEIRDIEIYAGPFWDGETKLIHATIHDVTQRKRTLESLRKAEEKYRSTVEQSVQGIMLTREDGTIISMNPAMANIMGYDSPEEAIKSISDVGAEVYTDPLRRKRLLKELQRRGHVKAFPIEFKRRDGSVAWVSSTTRAVFGDAERIDFIEAFAEDITSRVAAEEALAQSEKLYRAIVDNSLAAIYIFQDDKIVFLNKAFQGMLGYNNLEEALGKPFWEFIHPQDRQWVKQRAQARARGEDVKPHYGFRCIKKDGAVVWVDMQAAAITYHGKPAVLGNLLDITERKMLNDRLAQSQKMEAVGTLASGIAHDFNNILQAISGYVQMVMADGVSQLNMGRMKEIGSAVERAADLVQRMLAFSRDLEPQLIGVEINKEIRQTIKMLERTIPKWVNIKTDLAHDLPMVNGDPIGLEQMLMNLAANARDAMPDGGTLAITTSYVDIDESFCGTRPDLKPGEFIFLSVRDTGPGIDESTIKQIFDPFFSTKEIGRGTGLGLSQVYGTVKSHNGHIECESALGAGTEFKIYLPCRQAKHAAIDEADPNLPPAKGGGEALLLVDDEAAILEVSGQVLSDHGYDVTTADCAENALKILERLDYVNLVILDLGMPGMGGRRCLEKIKKDFPQTKVIVASGYADEDNRKWALTQGADAFMAKPYRLADLLNEIKLVLEN